ncbi:MAG: sulfite exporter TauE/SafE family protein [Bacteroidia bacterium]|nr:sulfite exporter TauE/SafE family protein [Bacteroidia bacterium]
MEYVVICIVAFLGSGLTLFSGFGLGTLLVPVFGIFFPIEIAIVLTAIVHFLNNIFKLFLVGKHANKNAILKFGIPSIFAAFYGAYLFTLLSDLDPIYSYHLLGREFEIMPIEMVIGILLIFFALFDLLPKLKNIQFDEKYLSLGGLLSGFFGGLSGNQGALRSAFLIRSNLSKESFIATGVVIACMIDITRLSMYSTQIFNTNNALNTSLIIAATLSAFLGAYIGNKVLKKITIKMLQQFVAMMLIIFALLLIAGII